jgi:hypothetical protein
MVRRSNRIVSGLLVVTFILFFYVQFLELTVLRTIKRGCPCETASFVSKQNFINYRLDTERERN